MRRITNPFVGAAVLFAVLIITISPVILALASPLLAPVITATKIDSFVGGDADGKADPGETIEYTVTINATGSDATGVTYIDTIDANTTLVGGSTSVSPVGMDDTFPVTVVGNVSINSANLVTPFSVAANDYLGLNPTATIAAYNAATVNGGQVVMTTTGPDMGKFTYNPPPGFEGIDTFTYTLADNPNATSVESNRTATVSITVTGMIWFVNNNAPACTTLAAGCGRLSNPFSDLASFNAVNIGGGNNPDNNDTIFIYESATPYTGGLKLRSGQKLIGQDATASLETITGLTLPAGSAAFPVMNIAAPAAAIHNAAGNGVSATAVVPAVIRGLSLSGSTNAIDITIKNAATGTLEIKDNTITGAGEEGIDINQGGTTAVLTLDVQNNTWNLTGVHTGNAFDARTTDSGIINLNFSNNTNILSTATAIVLDGSAGFGTFNVTGFANNTVHQNTAGTGISATSVRFDATPGGSFQQVAGGLTTIGVSGDGVGTSGMVLTTVKGDLAFTDLDIFANNGAGLQATSDWPYNAASGAGFQISVGSNVSIIEATGGPAVNLTTVTASLPLSSIKSTNSSSTGVSLVTVPGIFSAGIGSSITNATGTDFNIDGSNANVAYDGTITDDLGRLVAISNTTGGNKSFTGAITDGNDGDGTGISLTSNTGATITFSGGLALSTGANAAFAATDGGTVNVCDENPCNPSSTGSFINTLTTTAGTALNIANTNIGSNDLEFRSISANGATNGIILNTTGNAGNLVVTGNGGSCTSAGTCTGGAIQNTTADGISLTSTGGVSLTRLFVGSTANHGINTSAINGLTLTNSYVTATGNGDNEHGLNLVNVQGTVTIDGTSFNGASEDLIHLENNSTNATLTITNGSQFSYPASVGSYANSAILLLPGGSTSITASIQNSTFTNIVSVSAQIGANLLGSNGTQNFTFSNNTINVTQAGRASGVFVGGQEATTTNVTINNNNFSGAGGNGVISIDTNDTSVVKGTVSANTISNPPGIGIFVAVDEAAKSDVTLNLNTITNAGGDGIQTVNFGGTGTSNMDMTLTNNQINGHSQNIGVSFVGGISFVGFEDNSCVVLRGNTVTGTPADPTQCGGVPCVDYYLDEVGGVTTLEEVPDTAATTANAAYINSINDAGSPVTIFGTIDLTNGATCNSTGLGALLNNDFALDDPSSDSGSLANRAITEIVQRDNSFTASGQMNGRSTSIQSHKIALATNNSGSGKPVFAAHSAPEQSGETVNIGIGTLPAGKSVTITFQVTVNDPLPLGATKITNQGTVSGSNFTNVLTNNGGTVDCETSSETCTPVDRPDTTVTSISRDASSPTNAGSVSWTVTFADAVEGLTSSNFNLVNSGLGGAPAITGVSPVGTAPVIQWTVTASTGSGDGTLELQIANNTGLSHEVTNLPYTQALSGAVYAVDRTAPTTTSFARQNPATSPTDADTLVFRVTFSEAVMGVGTADFAVIGTTANVTTIASVSTGVYDVTVSGGDLANLDGLVSLNFSGSMSITDNANNALANGEPTTDQTYTVDNSVPTTLSFTRQTPATSPTNADTLVFRVTFSEDVINVDSTDFTVTGTTATVTGISAGTNVYDVTVSGGDLANYNGDVGLNFGGALDIQDAVGNAVANTDPATDDTYTVDNNKPSLTIEQAAAQSDPTGGSPINFTVTFSEDVTGFDNAADVAITGTAGATTSSITGGPKTYNVEISGMTGSGTVIVNIPASAAQDAAGNLSNASTSTDDTVMYDATIPTVTIDQAAAQSDPAGSSPINFTVVFSENVTDFDDASDVTLTGSAGATTINITGGPSTYNVEVSGMTSDGTITAKVPAGAAEDLAGNPNSISTSTDDSVVYDTVPPEVTINQASGQTDPTNSGPIHFTVVFSEDVTGFSSGDVTLSSPFGGLLVNVTGGPITYDVAVTGMSGTGTITATVGSGAANDLASKPNNASTSTDKEVTFDNVPPAAPLVGTPANGSATTDSTPPVTGTAEADSTITIYIDATVVGTTTANGAGNWSFTPGSALSEGAHVVKATAADAAGNTSPDSSTNTFTVDTTAPTVSMSSVSTNPTNGSPIAVNVTFSESVTDFIASDIVPGNAAVSNFSGSGANYSFDLTPSADGLVTANIAALVAQDAAGNNNTAATQFSRIYDTTAPTGAMSSTTTNPTNVSPILVTVQFSETISGFIAGDIDMVNGTVNNFASIDGDTYIFDLAPIGQGTVSATITAGSFADAGNLNFNTAAVSFSRVYDSLSPSVTIEQDSTQADPTNASPIHFTVVFSEPVSSFTDADVDLSGTASPSTAVVSEIASNDKTTYQVAVSGMTGDGTVVAAINASVVTDDAGNSNTASTSFDNTVTYNTDAPETTIDTNPALFSNVNTADFTFSSAAADLGKFECKLDGGVFSVCTSPQNLTGLSSGTHTFEVRAVDKASNVDITPASFSWMVDTGFPTVLPSSNTVPSNASNLTTGPVQITIAFSEDVKNDGSARSANTLANYMLVEHSANGTLDTTSCFGGFNTGDTLIPIDSVTYSNVGGVFVSTLSINGATPLSIGNYTLFICGTTSVEDLAGNELNNGISDATLNFAVVPPSAVLPQTGFPHGTVSVLPMQSADLAYTATDFWLEIPKLGVKMPIVGVPKTATGWDVKWLNKQAGWLNGSSYPTWNGNSVITGHVWNALNQPGPFAKLKDLKYGDQVKIHAFGKVYIYEIRTTEMVKPTGLSTVFKHEDKSWISLLTCEDYKEQSGTYSVRRLVRAVLVNVVNEK